ncbi:arylsulfatase [Pelagicoccus mobilis]|uniref:Arylsulfatase n=2 Tax=Pelagicoccus mobilis TaxID=415221 RepID=A0A934VMW0_9BACT|nr:arylsulfatase [Pelagicoccus mobilis]
MLKTFFVFFLSLYGCLALQAKSRPNIVLIMADDLGLGDLSHYVRKETGKEPVFETPTLDALAREGLWFTDGHSATALCSPTRYCVMSGNNNYRSYAPWGVWGTFRESAFVKGEATLGSVVKDAGYRTGFIGKWHLGGDFLDKKTGKLFRGDDRRDPDTTVDASKYVANGPKDCGFDYDFTLPCGIQGPIYIAYENEKWYPLSEDSELVYLWEENAINPKDVSDKGPGMGDSAWDTRKIGDLISSKAVDFIERQSEEEPFFLYYCSPMVHIPHVPPAAFDGQKIRGATPSLHLDMVVELDLQVKRIVEALKVKGVYEDTLIVFTSDNGGLVVDADTEKAGHDSSGLWAGSKNLALEGGHRVPFFAVWPDQIKPGLTDELAVNQDMLATFASLVGTHVPEDQARDSNNLLPLLLGEDGFEQRDFLVMQAGSRNELIFRKGDWKLIIKSDPKLSFFKPQNLFNLRDNPYEDSKKDLVRNPEYKGRVDAMLKEYINIRNSGVRTAPYNL